MRIDYGIIAGVVTSVAQTFLSGCIYIVQDFPFGFQEGVITLNLKKELEYSVSILSPKDVEQSFSQLICTKNLPLFVLLSKNNETYRFLSFLNKIRLSKAIWLLFLDSNLGLEELDIPLDCQFLIAKQDGEQVTLNEIYKLNSSLPIRNEIFANWSLHSGLSGSEVSLYKRRNDLKGVVFKAGTIDDFIGNAFVIPENETIDVEGYYGDVWKTLQRSLKFSSVYHRTPDDAYGNDLRNGSWSGLVGAVLNKSLDLSAYPLLWNTERSKVIDFVESIIQLRYFMILKKPSNVEVVWDSYLKPFNVKTWFSLLVLMILSAIILLILNKLWACTNGGETNSAVMEVLLFPLGTFSLQGQKPITSLTYERLVFFTVNVTALITMTCYSAFLISYITTKKIEYPFKNIEEFLNDGRYTFGVPESSAIFSYFKDGNNSLLQEMYHRHLKPQKGNLPSSHVEGTDWICTKEKYSVLYADSGMWTREYKCEIQQIPNVILSYDASMIIQKNSPYREILRYKLQQMRTTGIFNILQKRYFPKKQAEETEEFTSVSLNQILPIIVALVAGAALALFILFAEIVLYLIRQSHRQFLLFCTVLWL